MSAKALGPVLWAVLLVLAPLIGLVLFLIHGIWIGVACMAAMEAIGLKVMLGSDRQFWADLIHKLFG